jgi:hypothetical protein
MFMHNKITLLPLKTKIYLTLVKVFSGISHFDLSNQLITTQNLTWTRIKRKAKIPNVFTVDMSFLL